MLLFIWITLIVLFAIARVSAVNEKKFFSSKSFVDRDHKEEGI